MPKRKPDSVRVVRLELQDTERELVETAIYGEIVASNVTKIIQALASMDVKTLYAWITIFEVMGLLDSKIPTLADGEEILAAFGSWMEAGKTRRENEGRLSASDEKIYGAMDRLLIFLWDPYGHKRDAGEEFGSPGQD